MKKTYQYPRGLSVALCAFVVIPCAREVCGQTVYDFSTNAGVDRFAFGVEIPKTPVPPTVNDIPSTEFSAADYTAVAFSDDSRHSAGISATNQLRAAVRFAFTIADDPADITQIDVLFEGGGEGAGGNNIRVHVWNAVTSSYAIVGATNANPPPAGTRDGSTFVPQLWQSCAVRYERPGGQR